MGKKREITAKQRSFSFYYTDNTNKKTYNNGLESARAAAYKGNDNTLAAIASQNLTKLNVINEITKIKADKKVKYEHNEEIAIDLLRTDYAHLAEQAADGNVQAIQARTAIIRELNSACGINRTNIHTNIEQPAELTDEQVLELKAYAERATAIRLAAG